jgi:hypothetical protein
VATNTCWPILASGAGLDSRAQGAQYLQGYVLIYFDHIFFRDQGKIGERGLAEKAAVNVLIALMQSDSAIGPGAIEIL